MLIATETGYKQITKGFTNLVACEAPKILQRLEIEWVFARNYWVREYNKAVRASTDYLINGEWKPGPMKGLALLPELELPSWCKATELAHVEENEATLGNAGENKL